jgi:hypothetical protein
MPVAPDDERLARVGFARLSGPGVDHLVRKYEVLLGRRSKAADLDVPLGDLMSVSRRHAKIAYNFETGRWELELLGKNGAVVDGVSCEPGGEPVPLRSGAHLAIGGEVEFWFLLPTPPARLFRPAAPAPQPQLVKAEAAVAAAAAFASPPRAAPPAAQQQQAQQAGLMPQALAAMQALSPAQQAQMLAMMRGAAAQQQQAAAAAAAAAPAWAPPAQPAAAPPQPPLAWAAAPAAPPPQGAAPAGAAAAPQLTPAAVAALQQLHIVRTQHGRVRALLAAMGAQGGAAAATQQQLHFQLATLAQQAAALNAQLAAAGVRAPPPPQ